MVRDETGPPSDRFGINKFAPSFIVRPPADKYSRHISFSENGRYIIFQDYYGVDKLSSFQIIGLKNYIDHRVSVVFAESWKKDLKGELGKEGKEGGEAAVQIDIPWEPPKLVQSIIGEGKSNIRVSGMRSISFSGRSEWEDGLENTGTFKQSKFPTLQMEQKSRFKVTGTIGSKITVEVDQDSDRHTELANTIKLRYTGEEDEIIQTVEAGNTNLALPNAQFIGYSENVQGLFGIKSTAKIGDLNMTMITSQDKGSNEKASFSAGASENVLQIKDYEYLKDRYFWLRRDFIPPTDSLISVELYTNGEQTDIRGTAVVNPIDGTPTITSEERLRGEYEESRPFKQYDSNQFTLYRLNWFVVLDQSLQQNQVLGAYIKYADWSDPSNVDTIEIGNLAFAPDSTNPDSMTLVLKLIKDSTPDSSFTTWDYMWRNVYDLRTRNVSAEGFEFKVFQGAGGAEGLINDPDDQDGTCFITILGLDSLNNNTNNPGPDCLFDFNNTVIDAGRGHVIFPPQLERPFDFTGLNVRAPEIYTVQSNLEEYSKYWIYVKTAERASTFSLGRANIIEGSEVVKLSDGTVLRRGVDYSINYDIGQITFLSEEALNPGANVSVNFEYAPFFLPEKKSLFGLAGQYSLLENSNISMAAMYRSETVTDPRPRVGREPRKGLVWDGNFAFNFQPGVMTSLVDALPLIEADANSALNISGEVAQSFPNPNTKDKAYIDDFEGTRNYTDMSNRRGMWTSCSPPLYEDGSKLPQTYRGDLWWYNPYDPVRITEIWPEREVQAQDDRHDVLFLHYFPDSTAIYPESSWTGIMRPFFTGLADQTQTKFIEFWYKPDPNALLEAPKLHLNFGFISEDIDDDGVKDTEDRLNGREDGIFQVDEDTGLDGLFSVNEPGYSAGNPDPSGDDWAYDDDNPNDYSRINGTEGNRNDPDRRGRMDSEDINNNGSLDTQDGYYEYIIDLDDPDYYVEATSTGWNFVRIPFQDPEAFTIRGAEGSADFARINYARMWLTGSAEPYLLQVALFQLVGNKWKQQEISMPEGDSLIRDEKFEIAVKNTQENSDYYPPPGVAGELDRKTGIREKEQSLVLNYQNLKPGHTAIGYWQLYQPENYTLYNRIRMFVYGDESAGDSSVIFFFRMGQDSTNFYEFRTILEPGWSANNEVDIDFTGITRLKYEMQQRLLDDTTAVADTVVGKYRVKGNPSLSAIKRFAIGVTAIPPPDNEITPELLAPVSGEVWLDELRVTDVRKESDFASRMQVTAKFSDFFDVSLNYSKTGADFFPLSAKVPSGATSINRSLRFSVRLDRFFPPSFGLSLPVTYSWQNTLSLPRLKPGSDIILSDDSRRDERSESTQRSYTINQSFNRNTKNPIWNLTLNRIKTNYSYSKSVSRSPANPIGEQERYKGTGNYDLTPRSKPSVKPFFWTKFLFLPRSLHDTQLMYLPTKLTFGAEINGNNSYTINQRGIPTYTRTKDLSLNASTGLGLFSSLKSNYSLGSVRDISDPKRFRLSIDPSKLKLGQEREFQQRFDTSYQPKIIKLFDQRFSFNSSYLENSDLKRNPDSTRTSVMQSAMRADVTFKISELFPKGQGGRGAPRRPENPPKQPGGDIEDDDYDEDDDEGRDKFTPLDILGGVFNTFKSIKPIKGSYVKDKKLTRQGLIERPSWEYIFGISENPKARSKATTGPTPNQTIYSDTYKFDSGLKPGRNFDFGISYSTKTTVTLSTTEPTRSTSVTFPDISVNISGLEQLPVFKKLSRTATYQLVYSKNVDENGREDTGELYKRNTSRRFSPLVGLNFTFKNNVRATIRFDRTRSKNEYLRETGQSNRTEFDSNKSFKINITYSLTAPKGLKLPFLRKIKFDSQLSMSLDVEVSRSKRESLLSGTKSTDADRSDIKVQPRLTYQFSRSITGGIRALWNDTNDKVQQRKHHIRELGITTEIRF
ncbi:MAG: cell surface protein SprA [Candidatus Zixiibacteriota bacterium]|nr:MAG: cell surface protein SprA [candidate division Zixibacteria bacterium]